MKFKLVLAMVNDDRTDDVIEKAREMGATGATVITAAKGEGLNPSKTFFGLTLEGQVDVVLFVVEEVLRHSCRNRKHLRHSILVPGHYQTFHCHLYLELG